MAYGDGIRGEVVVIGDVVPSWRLEKREVRRLAFGLITTNRRVYSIYTLKAARSKGEWNGSSR